MDAAHGAVRGAGFLGQVFAADIFDRVFFERRAGVAALLRAVVHQAVLADIHVAGAGAALPVIGLALRDGVLEKIEPREVPILHRLHLVIDLALLLAQRTKLAVAIVNDADRGGEAELDGAAADHQSVVQDCECRRRPPS